MPTDSVAEPPAANPTEATPGAAPPAPLGRAPESGAPAKPDLDVGADPGLMPELRTGSELPKGTPATQPQGPDERSTEFVAVEGGQESTSAEALLVSAYAVMWVLLLAFVFFTFRRQQAVESRLAELERAVSGDGEPAGR
jgi:CcmD family protein